MFIFSDEPLRTKKQVQDLLPMGSLTRKAGRLMQPDPFASSLDEPTSPPLVLGGVHHKTEELKNVHSQRHRMTTDQFRFRTCALHLPKSTHDLSDKVRSECEVCQAAKQAKRVFPAEPRTYPCCCQHRRSRTSLSPGTTLTSATCSPNQLSQIKPTRYQIL